MRPDPLHSEAGWPIQVAPLRGTVLAQGTRPWPLHPWLQAVAQQLAQLRTALAVAVALNRTIIMPRVSGGLAHPAATTSTRAACLSHPSPLAQVWLPSASTRRPCLQARCCTYDLHSIMRSLALCAPPPAPPLPSGLQLISWCDRYWGPVEFCQLPGAFKLRLPFVAPMDHWLGEALPNLCHRAAGIQSRNLCHVV